MAGDVKDDDDDGDVLSVYFVFTLCARKTSDPAQE